MSIVKRNGNGKLVIDWGSLIPMLVSLILSGVVTGFGSYYAIRYDIRQQDYRLTKVEEKADGLSLSVANLQLKDATDSANFANACTKLEEIRNTLNEIRKDTRRH